jgi:phosphatidylserine/phosphatidylglycerophosphate/cardiolipin synthase-like enzyme
VARGPELLLVQAGMDAWLRGEVAPRPMATALQELEARALLGQAQLPSREARVRARARLAQLVRFTSVWGTLPRALPPSLSAEVRVVSGKSRYVAEDDSVNGALVRCLASARRTIEIETPYFVLTPRLLRALTEASARGVAIRVMTNSPVSSDNAVAQALFVDSAPELLARMGRLRIFVPTGEQALHLKRIVIDDQLTLLGTFNMDPFSAHLNSETLVAVWSRALNRTSRRGAERRMADALEYRIVRDALGRVLRYPDGSAQAGRVMMVFGPADHTPPERLAELAGIKEVVVGFRDAWDFEVAVW